MDDLISRQKAIDAIDKYFDDLPIQGYYDMLRIIKNLPTIEPRRGKWEKMIGDGRLGKQVRCGYCGEQFWAWMSQYHYCPNCGAKNVDNLLTM